MTPREEQAEAFKEMCLVYIAQSESAEQLDSVGQEIAVVMRELGVVAKELDGIKRKYVAKRRTFNGTNN